MGLMTMQAQVRAVRSRSMRPATLPAGVLPNAASFDIVGPYARVPFTLRPGAIRADGVRDALQVPDWYLGQRGGSSRDEAMLDPGTLWVIVGIVAAVVAVAGAAAVFCLSADAINAQFCKAQKCNGQPCNRTRCLLPGPMCCDYECPTTTTAGSTWGTP